MQIAILAYENMTVLDGIGPYQVLVRLPGAEVKWVAAKAGPVLTDTGMCIVADSTFADVPRPYIILIPGGLLSKRAMDDETLEWIRTAHETTAWTVSVCTGSLVLGRAGLLKGLKAATHWAARDELAQYGAIFVRDRVVREGKIITGAGVSAGIDTALYLAEWEAGPEVAKTIQLCIQYDPKPPYDSGAPWLASPEVVKDARAYLDEAIAKAQAQDPD